MHMLVFFFDILDIIAMIDALAMVKGCLRNLKCFLDLLGPLGTPSFVRPPARGQEKPAEKQTAPQKAGFAPPREIDKTRGTMWSNFAM